MMQCEIGSPVHVHVTGRRRQGLSGERVASFLQPKIPRATVAHADFHCEGSLMEESHIAEFEEVSICNVTTGTRLATY